MNLDLKDRKILHQLEIDARQSTAAIGRKVRLSREVTAYRIKRLEKAGIITKYALMLNSTKIGYQSFKWYLQLENCDEKDLQRLTKELYDHPHSAWVATCTGKWDIIVVFLVESPHQFNTVMTEFLSKNHSNVRATTFTTELDVHHYARPFMGNTENRLLSTPFFGGEIKKLQLSKEDVHILTELSTNARQSSVDISKKTKLTVDIIRNRMRRMTKSGIIQGTRVQTDPSKMGLTSYKILLSQNQSGEKEMSLFDSYISLHKNVWDVIHCLGGWNMEINVDVTSSQEFHNIILDMKNRFPRLIGSYDFVQIFTVHKYTFFPMGESLIKASRNQSVSSR